MNVCKHIIKRINIPNPQIYSGIARCSTLTNTEASKPEELDKLYKTVELELRGNDPAVLNSYAKFSTSAATHLDVEAQSWAARKPQHDRHLTGSTADTLLEYLERNLPEGVALKATKVELQKIPDHIVPPQDELPQPTA